MIRLWILFGVAFVSGFAAEANGIAIVVSKSRQATISLADAQEVFLGKKKVLQEGWPVELVDQASSSEIRRRFYKALLQKELSEIQTHWAELVFSGRAKAPVTVHDDQDVLKYIESHPNAIGYITDESHLTSKATVLIRLPAEAAKQ